MNKFSSKITACLCSPDLREKHNCLTWLIKHLISLFNKEIGIIGNGGVSEILRRQEQIIPEEMKNFRPFIFDNDSNVLLEINLATIAYVYEENGRFAVATEIGDRTEWFLMTHSCVMENLMCDVCELTRAEVEIAAKRLCFVFIILSAVYWNPKNVLCQTALELAQTFDFLPHDFFPLPIPKM